MRRRFNPYVLLFVLIFPIVSILACENESGPIIQWSKTFGARAEDQGHSVQQTTDGGYIICGTTELSRAQGEDVWLIKTDADGNKLWDKKFGGSDNDIGNSVQQTTDGGYILCGSTYSYGAGSLDIWLIKTDASGNKLWDKTFGGTEYDDGVEVKQTSDGGYIVCGTTGLESIWLIKTDSEGNKIWDNTFEGNKTAMGYSVQEDKGGGYIVAGETRNDLNHEVILLTRTDAGGNKIWDKTFDDGRAPSVQQTTDGGYILCGRSSAIGVSKVTSWLIKTDAEGNMMWDKMFASGGKRGGTWTGDSAIQTADGGYVICGTRLMTDWTEFFRPLPTSSYIWLIKTDANGNELWDKKLPGKDSGWGNSVQQTVDGGYIVCGSNGSYVGGGNGVLLLKIAAEQ